MSDDHRSAADFRNPSADELPPEDARADDEEWTESGFEKTCSIIRVRRHHDLHGLGGLISTAPTSDIILDAPWGHSGLRDRLSLKRLSRLAEASGKRLAVATCSSRLAAAARDVGLPAGLRPAHVRWQAPGSYLIGWHGRTVPWPTNWSAVFAGVLVLIALASVAFAIVAFGPQTEVRATVPLQELERSVSLRASTDFDAADVESGQVPATYVTRSERLTLALPAEGRVPVGQTRSQVIVSLTNESGADLLLPKGLVLVAPNGDEFTLDLDTHAPAGESVIQQVTAEHPGGKGNLPSGAVIRAGASDLHAVSGVALEVSKAGTDVLVPGVDEGDLQRVRSLAERMETSMTLKERLLSDIPGLVFMETAEAHIRPLGGSAQLGLPSDAVIMDAELLVSALVVDAATLEEFGRALLPADRTGEVVDGTFEFRQTGRATITADGTVQVPVDLALLFAPNVDRDEMRAAIEGKRVPAARQVLEEQFGATAVEVKRSPSFWPWIPSVDSRLEVVLSAAPAPSGSEQVSADPVD